MGREVTQGLAPASSRPPQIERIFDPGGAPSLETLACSIYSMRRERRRYFGSSLFGEAAWDMLLLLYWADANGHGLNANILIRAVGGPTSTAMRWLKVLESEGLVVQRQTTSGHLSRIVELTEPARKRLTEYLKHFESTRP